MFAVFIILKRSEHAIIMWRICAIKAFIIIINKFWIYYVLELEQFWFIYEVQMTQAGNNT